MPGVQLGQLHSLRERTLEEGTGERTTVSSDLNQRMQGRGSQQQWAGRCP